MMMVYERRPEAKGCPIRLPGDGSADAISLHEESLGRTLLLVSVRRPKRLSREKTMARIPLTVRRALKRWEEKGLLDPVALEGLRREAEEEAQREGRRWFQYLLAITGGAVLIVAGGTFLAWVWPELGAAGQAVTLAVLGLAILVLGVRLPKMGRMAPVAYLLQLAGTILVIMAMIHSEQAWADGTAGGCVVGILALGMPVALFMIAVQDHGILAGLQAAFSFLFLFVFFDRALGLSNETTLWILDGLMVVALCMLAVRLRDPAAPDWVLSVFLTLLLSTIILIVFSAEILWDMEAETIYPMDLWLLTVAGLCLWGMRETSPPHLRRDWYELLLALCVLIGIGFAFITMLEAIDIGPTAAALVVAVIGLVGLWYSFPRGMKAVAGSSCVALLIAAWYWGEEMSGALGAVFALVVVSVALFWVATRIGRVPNGVDEKGVGTDGV
jgi:hypothetical protein